MSYVVHHLRTPISAKLWMHLWTDWIGFHSELMKNHKDLEGIAEVEEDTEVDELVEEDQSIAIIVMRKDTFQETVHF
jgi:hypothetical protein